MISFMAIPFICHFSFSISITVYIVVSLFVFGFAFFDMMFLTLVRLWEIFGNLKRSYWGKWSPDSPKMIFAYIILKTT